VDKVVRFEGPLQVPQVLLHAYPQNKQGVLVRQVDELGDGCSLMVNLLLEELFSGSTCSHTGLNSAAVSRKEAFQSGGFFVKCSSASWEGAPWE
jgi:hypothetical protein